MTLRTVLIACGAGLSTTLIVAVVVIELLAVEFSAIVGLPVGLLAGLLVLVGLLLGTDRLGPTARRVVSAYGTIGPVVLGLLALSYVNIGRNVLSVDVVVGIAIVAAVTVFFGSWLYDWDRDPPLAD